MICNVNNLQKVCFKFVAGELRLYFNTVISNTLSAENSVVSNKIKLLLDRLTTHASCTHW